MLLPRLLVFVSVLCLLAVAPVAAQVGSAEIAGTITDESASALPGVTVTARHVETGQVRTTTTEGGGTYLITALPVGRYQVRAELTGFSPIVLEDVVLSIGQKARIDLHLKVATVQETITVTGETPLVDTSSSDLSGRISQAQVEQLPLSGRNWMNLAAMAPGVKSEAGGNQPTAGLGDSRMSKVYLDGGSVQNLSTVAVDIQVSKEVIGEFEVVTNRFDAVMGRAGTAVVNAVTKAGTDNFRGSTFFYWRDDSLNAKDFFTNRVEPYQNRQFGGVFGGPIVRGKTHFLASYERQEEPKTLSSNTGFAAYDVPVDSTDSRNLYFGRIDHSITPNHRANLRLNRYTLKQDFAGVGGLVVPSGSSNARFEINRANLSVNSVFGNRFVNQFLVTYMDSLRQWTRVDPGLAALVPVVCDRRPAAGHRARTPASSGPSVTTHRTVFERGGQHHLKFGGEYQFGNVQGHSSRRRTARSSTIPTRPTSAPAAPASTSRPGTSRSSRFPSATRRRSVTSRSRRPITSMPRSSRTTGRSTRA